MQDRLPTVAKELQCHQWSFKTPWEVDKTKRILKMEALQPPNSCVWESDRYLVYFGRVATVQEFRSQFRAFQKDLFSTVTFSLAFPLNAPSSPYEYYTDLLTTKFLDFGWFHCPGLGTSLAVRWPLLAVRFGHYSTLNKSLVPSPTYKIQTPQILGYQYGSPITPDSRVDLDLFDPLSKEHWNLSFHSIKGSQPLTQSMVNTIVGSLKSNH
jgi:hypothetical protein